jgi:Ca2+-binding EF-hand superfamily protein
MHNATKTLLTVLCITGVSQAWAQPPGGPGGILRMDSDGDGQISREEFQLPAERRGPRFFEDADADGDGNISRDELLANLDQGADEREAQRRERLLERFDRMDADGNGVVERAEILDQTFARMDANGDGFVTEDEARSMHESRKGRRAQNARPE